ncbi:hypothetical protein KCP70_01980 [Salmonella enterica subsp. enterica]|nr:hypothetical protein KCP70_01980 [Salmonella enterica subsp. enterica]
MSARGASPSKLLPYLTDFNPPSQPTRISRRPAISCSSKHRNAIRRLADIDNIEVRYPRRCASAPLPIPLHEYLPGELPHNGPPKWSRNPSGFNAYHFFGIHGIHHGRTPHAGVGVSPTPTHPAPVLFNLLNTRAISLISCAFSIT